MKNRFLKKGFSAILAISMLMALLPASIVNVSAVFIYDSTHWYNGVSIKSNGNDVPQPLFSKEFILLKNGYSQDEPEYANYLDTDMYDFYAIGKTGRVYGDISENKFALDFSESPTSGVYQLDIKAFYNGPMSGIFLDIDFNEEKLEICRPDGTSLSADQLLSVSGAYKIPSMSDWADSGIDLDLRTGYDNAIDYAIIYDDVGWAKVARYDGDEVISENKNMRNLFASNDVSRTDDPTHIGNFSIGYDTRSYANKLLNPENGFNNKLLLEELMCPAGGLSLGTVYFKLKDGVGAEDLEPTDFTRDLKAAKYLHTYYVNPVSKGSKFIDFSGADMYYYYNDSEKVPYAADLEIDVLGKKRFEDHSYIGTVDSAMLGILFRVRMDDNDIIQPILSSNAGVGEVAFTKYYKQQGSEIPTVDSPGWVDSPDGKIPNTYGPGIYFLMVDVGYGDLYRGAKNIILAQTFKIVEAKTVTAAQLDFDGSYANRNEHNITKMLIVHPQASVSGMGAISVSGYRLSGTSEWIDADTADHTRPIPYYIAPGVYDLKVNIAEGIEWHGADVVLAGVFTVTSSSYTVTFEDHDGTELKTDIVSHGNAAVAPPNPSRDGYIFTGWDESFNNITYGKTITAQYTPVRMAGDVNGDGLVGAADVVTLRRYLAGWPGVTIDESAADVNGDGAVGAADVIVLRRYLAGWIDVLLV